MFSIINRDSADGPSTARAKPHVLSKSMAFFVGSVAALLVLAAGACDSQPPGLGSAATVVYGQVTTPEGRPIDLDSPPVNTDSARVLVFAYFADFEGQAIRQNIASADDSGFYESFIQSFNPRIIDSVKVVVDLPPLGEDVRDDSTTVTTNLATRDNPPYDSLRVDVVVQPPNK